MREINVLLAIDRTQATYAAVIVRGFIRILSKGTPPSTAKDSEIVQCMYVFQKRPCMPLRWRRWRRRSNSLISISLSRTSIINIELVLYKPTLCSFSFSLRMSGVTLASLARSTTNGDCLILCVAGLVSERPLKWSQVFRVIFYSVSLFSVIVKYCNSIGYMSGISMCSQWVESLLFKMPSWYIDWGDTSSRHTKGPFDLKKSARGTGHLMAKWTGEGGGSWWWREMTEDCGAKLRRICCCCCGDYYYTLGYNIIWPSINTAQNTFLRLLLRRTIM